MPQPKIKVFWDLDTCPPPTSSYTSPWEILKDVRLFTSYFGVVTVIKAYWDSSKASDARTDAGAKSFRAAMPSMGLTLVDCSLTKGYAQIAPTKILTVDVLISIIDEPMGSNDATEDIIMILSGDDSVLYPISLLMFRNYTIFLVVPDEYNDFQPFQATRVFKWHRDVLGFKLKDPTAIARSRNSAEASQPHEFQAIGHGTSVSPRGAAAATAPSAHSSLSRADRSNAVPNADSRSNMKSLPTSEPFDSSAPSLLGSGPHAFQAHTIATTHYDHASTKSKQAALDTWSQSLPDQVTLLPSDMNSNHGWEAGDGGWDTDGGWEANSNPWVIGSTKASKNRTRPRTEGAIEPGPAQPTIEIEQSEALTHVPLSVFDPLLQVLREAKKRSMGRSKLGEELAKNKIIYKAAGVKGFAEYIALAAAKDLVIAGGVDSNQYVRLHPKLKNT